MTSTTELVFLSARIKPYDFVNEKKQTMKGNSYKLTFHDPDGYSPQTSIQEFTIEEEMFLKMGFQDEDTSANYAGQTFNIKYRSKPQYYRPRADYPAGGYRGRIQDRKEIESIKLVTKSK